MSEPLVGIVVGSESDRERMQDALDELDARGIPHEFEIRSAHRQPDAVAEYGRTARERGREPGAGDQDAETALAGRAAVLRHRVRLAVCGPHLELVGNAPRFELVERVLHPLAIGLRADDDADDGVRHV